MRYLLLGAVLLAGCNTAPPPPPVPRVPAVTLKPISDNNAAIKRQNQTLRQTNTSLQAKIDASIVAAHQARLEADKPAPDTKAIDTQLDAVDAAQVAAKAFAQTQAETIGQQAATITAQDNTIVAKQGEVDNVKKIADKQSTTLDQRNQQVANLEVLENEVNAHWGLGAIWYGIKRLGWHLLIVLAVLAALGFVLNMFVPALQPLFAAIVKWFVAIPGVVVAFLKHLWPKKPPP